MRIKRVIKKVFLVFAFIAIVFAGYFFVGRASQPEKIAWGVNFSAKYSESLGLEWREVYSALVEDLGARNLKIAVHWDIFEPEQGNYNFADLDWQIKIAEENKAKIIPVIGMKTSRWPECHLPDWARNLGKTEQQEKILEMIRAIVSRYKDSRAIKYWQVENEPFFLFGECPWQDREFLVREIKLVKTLDPAHPVMITDTGEWSFWFKSAKLGDLVGTTMYRQAWMKEINFSARYHFPAVSYSRKALLIKLLFGKKVICAELQAEPWGKKPVYELPLEEQEKTMNLKQFQENIRYAQKSGLDEFYFWGGEWWFWQKKQGHPEIWNEAKKLF
ncbi:MAG: hypothetical protein COT34_01030 [Candidatus Nealsonbacteria bacterium CG08_land_8_20_14_0_20_43_11]|uniref:GH10 domain-containing protein n=1 Tax=Candidatus Nealsonbacteria bacterium CG08_land_8_20_14_0_20_43_11 TaxID=1974706 RepID=A0A2M6T177_9BACT|nr:MAG: hypothetical protein COT34_01030 [Candidatus Nealsonbacteria bacterium CG08_land_8_20_14_0_20_43_11]